MTPSRILVVGSGGREHALAWRLARDPGVEEVLTAPGNDGIGRTCRRLAVTETDGEAIAAAAAAEHVDLVVIGPDAALAAGVADRVTEKGIPVYGPTRAAARLEWSKWFAKEVMAEAGAPTARAARFTELAEARRALPSYGPPWVVKADGLAAGKGVLVSRDRTETEAFLGACLEGGRFGDSGRSILIEECLEGEELSLTAVCDGEGYRLLAPARDYKRALDADQGPNTGGMGAYAPAADLATAEQTARVTVTPILGVMARRGAPFRGTMYLGMMRTAEGPKVLEINARFGDPETQVITALFDGSFSELLWSAATGRLDRAPAQTAKRHAVAVALVDRGYPEKVRGGGALLGLDRAAEKHGVEVFHAGTRWDEGAWRIQGGRAAYVMASAETRDAARDKAYAAIADVGGEGWRCRSDIAAGGSMAAVTRSKERSGGA